MDTPVVLIVFRRPETTRRVLDAIRRLRPPKLFIVADGPRPYRPGEAEECAAARAAAENIDWPCDVQRSYSAANMGCGRRVASGITWVFEQVEEAIILEDDCLPHPSFFGFCQTLLERYRHDTRIMHIGGASFQNGIKRGPYSYFFSRYSNVWGWATWRRAWSHFDPHLTSWSRLKGTEDQINMFDSEKECSYWSDIFDIMASNRPIDTWDFSWVYACFTQGLSIQPNANLISNIGFGADASHTQGSSPFAALPTFDIGELHHPPWVFRNRKADMYTFDHVYGARPTERNLLIRYLAGQMLRKLGMRDYYLKMRDELACRASSSARDHR